MIMTKRGSIWLKYIFIYELFEITAMRPKNYVSILYYLSRRMIYLYSSRECNNSALLVVTFVRT